MRILVELFTAENGYYHKFLSDRYETSNRDYKLLLDGATLQGNDCFIYSSALTLELKTYLTD